MAADSAVATPFSIHQELWQEVWLAATAAVKSRKKHQVDFNIQNRVEQLLQDFGPQSDTPLTLRVYGTMLKGFCVLNNERARLLYTDSERVVAMFAQRLLLEDSNGVKLPAAKRQRTDALALDLDLKKVPESEIFGWSQAPLEDAAFLQPLEIGAPLPLADAEAPPQHSLLEDARLLDESFPPIDMQAIVPLDAAAEAVRMAAAAEAAAAAGLDALTGSAPGAFPLVVEVARVQDMSTGVDEQPAPSMAELIAAAGNPNNLAAIVPPDAAEEPQLPIQRRGPRQPPQLPGAGHVFGFDFDTLVTSQELDVWQLSCQDIGDRAKEPAEFFEMWLGEQSEPDRLGMLHTVLDPTSDAAAIHRMIARSSSSNGLYLMPHVGQDGSMPEVQALLAGSSGQDGASNLRFDGDDGGPVEVAEGLPASSSLDPFRPYLPSAPSSLMQGADMELTGLLGVQGTQVEESGTGGAAEDQEDDVEKYDEQTAKVAAIFHRYVERTGSQTRKVSLDDLIPPSSTDKEVAAKTFLAVLTLATAGDLGVEQMQAYGPITIAVP